MLDLLSWPVAAVGNALVMLYWMWRARTLRRQRNQARAIAVLCHYNDPPDEDAPPAVRKVIDRANE